MKNYTLWCFLFSTLLAASVQAQVVFRHVTNASNTQDHLTTLDHPQLNGNPNALVFIMPNYNTNGAESTGADYQQNAGVFYSGGRWIIFNQNTKAAMPPNLTFNVLVAPPGNTNYFTTTCTAESKAGLAPNGMVIDHPATNNKNNALLLITQNWNGVYNDNSPIVSYANGKWYISNNKYLSPNPAISAKSTMPIGARFNVMVIENGQVPGFLNSIAYLHTVTEANRYEQGYHITYLDHPKLNSNTDAIVFATPNWGWSPGGTAGQTSGPYNDSPINAWYDHPNDIWNYRNGFWSIFNSDGTPFPVGCKINVLAFPSNATTSNNTYHLAQHLATRANSNDTSTILDDPALNGKPNALIIASPVWQENGDDNVVYPYVVRYNGQRWTIQTLQNNPFFYVTQRVRFNLLVYEGPGDSNYVHTVTPANRIGNYTILNHPALNRNPDAVVLITQRYNTVNNHHIGVWYRNGRWAILNLDRANMPVGAQFNVVVTKKGVKGDNKAGSVALVHTHTNSGQLGGVLWAYTKIDHPKLNYNPDYYTFATQRWTGAYNPHGFTVWYDRPGDNFPYRDNHWLIYNGNNATMPINTSFNFVAFGKINTDRPSPLPALCFDRLPSQKSFDQNPQIAPGQYWKNGQTLRILIDKTFPQASAQVQQYIQEWQQYVNLKFDFVAAEPADIRITFQANQGDWAWSGSAASTQNPSLNLGSVSDTTKVGVLRPLVLRLFAQALGAVHEHQHPATGIPWDVEATNRYYAGPPNFWSPFEVAHNLLTRYERSRSQFTLQDPQSILRFGVPNELTLGDVAILPNEKITESDVRFMRSIYPATAGTGATPKLRLSIETGSDDLRISSQARLLVRLKNSTERIELPLNRGASWGPGTSQTQEIILPAGTTAKDVLGCTLHFFGGLPYSLAPEDSWTINGFQLNWVDGNGSSTSLAALKGNPLAKLTTNGPTVYTLYFANP